MYNLSASDTFQMQVVCTFFFFSCELKHCFVRIQIRVFNYNVFRAKLIQIAVDSCCVYFNKRKQFAFILSGSDYPL